MENRNETLKKIVLSAIMIAIGTVLSLDMFKFGGLWLFGGGVTFCSMLPLVIVSYIYGCRWGAFTAFAYSLIQLVQGVDNVQYATSVPMAIAIILLDYIIAYTVIGFAGMFKNVIKNQPVALAAEYIQMYTEMTDHNTLPSQIAEQRKIIDNANKKKSKLLQLSVDGMIADIDFKHMTAQSNKEIEEAERQIQELNSQLETSDEFRKKIDAIKKTLAAAQRDAAQGIISKEFVERYIDKILVTPEEDGSMTLNIRIFTGETTKKSLQEIRRRTGHTFLTM